MKQVSELPVKRIEDFDGTESDAKLVRRPSFWLGFIVFAGLASTIALVASTKLGVGDPTWFFVALFAVVCFGVMRIIDLYAESKAELKKKIFDQYLATINYEMLKVVTASPEYDKETKDAVSKYLSAAHPGWSLT